MYSSEPLVSVIVPVYNTGNYLRQCLDSIVNQTYKNLEIILIDDGSEDDSGKICDEYASKDSRIVVVHKINQGVSQARNDGISACRGEFVTFIDSDDWVDEKMLEAMLSAMIQGDAQSVMCAYIREYPDNSLPRILHSENVIWDGKAFQRRVCGPVEEELKNPENLDCYVMMCGKLYPASAIKETKVTDLNLIGSSEDTLFNFKVFSNIDNILYVNEPFYHYRKELSSSVSGSYKPKLESQWDNLYAMMLDFIKENQLDSSYDSALNNRIALNVLGIGLNCVQGQVSFKVKYERIKKALSHQMRNRSLKQLSLKYMPIHWKLFFFSAKHKLSFFVCALLIIISGLRGKV